MVEYGFFNDMTVSSQSESQRNRLAASEIASTKFRIFVVDAHRIFREAIIQLLNSEHDLVVCGQAGSATETISRLRDMKADLILLEISLEGANGIELTKQICAEHPGAKIVILSRHDESLYAGRAFRAGAGGYVMKSHATEEVLKAIRMVLDGKLYVSPEFREQLVYKFARGTLDGSASPISVLSDRETEVLRLVGLGNTTRQIADQLHLSTKTIETHRLRIRDKLGMKSAPELTRFALEWVTQDEQH